MEIIEPVLFPIVFDELEILKFIGKENIKNADILIDFNYQRDSYPLLYDYIDPMILESDNPIYEKYYHYFKVEAMKRNITYEEYLEDDHDFTFMKTFKLNLISQIKSYYNTVIIPHMFTKWEVNICNTVNRFCGYPPNFFFPSKILKVAVTHLIEGGYLHIPKFRNENFDKIRDGIYQKKVTEKKEYKHRINAWF